MKRAIVLSFCLPLLMVLPGLDGAHAAKNGSDFMREWDATKPDLGYGRKVRSSEQRPDAAESEDGQDKPKPIRKRKGSSSPPDRQNGPDSQQSARQVCRSQCELQRMSCDQGRNSPNVPGQQGFTSRPDQLQAAQSSCYLAVQSCLSRC